jgi:hypothetical protein
MLTDDWQHPEPAVRPGDDARRYAETAARLRALAARLSADVEAYESSPRALDNAIVLGRGEAGNAESVITSIFELMKWQVLAERAPLQANPEVWAAFQEQQPEFIRFFRAVQAALEVYGETLRIYQQVSGEAGYGARPGDLDGVRRDKHVQVEERAHCIAAVREFSGKFSAMLAVL